MYPDYQMRLFKKGKGKFPALHVHEMIDVDGKTAYLGEHITHYNFETISQFLYKHIELYAPNEAEALLKKGYTFSPHDAIGFPLREFLSRFFAREGYKDGLHGLVLSMLLAFYHLVIFAKIWEKRGFKEYNSSHFLDTVSKQLRKGFDEISYWIANEKLKRSKSLLEQTMLKVQRKLKS
jgi:(heptosyl)LPS beta-1,4-glucosyltransferase